MQLLTINPKHRLEARQEKNVNEMTMYKATHSLLDLFEIYWLVSGYLVHTRCIIGYGRVFLLHVNIRIIILSCIYLGHSDATVLISNIQLETNNGSKQQGNIYRLDISRCSLKGIQRWRSIIVYPNTTVYLLLWEYLRKTRML